MWRGDLGYSDLLDRRDVPKHDLRFEVLGSLDEASSALGLARAVETSPEAKALVLDVQRDLCWMMSELAAENDDARPSTHITEERVGWLDSHFQMLSNRHPPGQGFVVPGDSPAGAALHLARTIVRRAERNVTQLHAERPLHNPAIITYLNHLSALLYVLARAEDIGAGVNAPTPAKPASNGHA
jgi:cob(I)alamin adenosyltransferase